LPAFAPERQWRFVWGAVVLAGVALAVADWGLPAVVAGIALDTAVVACLVWVLRAPFVPSYAARPVLRRSLVGVCVVVALAAIATASPTLAVVVTLGAAVTSPQLRRLAHPVVLPRTQKDRNHLHL
jgi:hypothetical protein